MFSLHIFLIAQRANGPINYTLEMMMMLEKDMTNDGSKACYWQGQLETFLWGKNSPSLHKQCLLLISSSKLALLTEAAILLAYVRDLEDLRVGQLQSATIAPPACYHITHDCDNKHTASLGDMC